MRRISAVFLALLFICIAVSCKDNAPSSTPTASNPSSTAPSSSESPSSSTPSKVEKPSSDKTETSSGSSSSAPVTPEPEPSVHAEHYCYAFLSDIQKIYYESMHTAAEEMNSSWIVLGEFSEDYAADIAVVRTALAADHPDIFWLPHYYVIAKGSDSEGNPAALMMFSSSGEISPAYLVSRADKPFMEEELSEAVEEIASQVTATDPFEIELQLHDLLCERVEYSDDKSDPLIFTSYGALVNRRALCEGYSRAMQLLLSKFQIKSTVVSGTAEDEGHMWNAVEIGGKWYNLDVTWNDSPRDAVSYEYFNITDAEILLDHTPSKNYTEIPKDNLGAGLVSFNIAKPDCFSTGEGYFEKKGFIYNLENKLELVDYITLSERDIVEVKFKSAAERDAFLKNYQREIEEINQEIVLKSTEISYYIERVSVSTLTVKFYKEQKDEV